MKATSSSEQKGWINEKSEDGTCGYIKHALFFSAVKDSVKIVGNGEEDSLHLASNLANAHWIIHFLSF